MMWFCAKGCKVLGLCDLLPVGNKDFLFSFSGVQQVVPGEFTLRHHQLYKHKHSIMWVTQVCNPSTCVAEIHVLRV